MPLELPEKCPACGLILLAGAILDAAAQKSSYGPILGLHPEATAETAKAGYVGLSSLWAPEQLRALYRCPRCSADPLIERDS
jgi:hypothetical protein